MGFLLSQYDPESSGFISTERFRDLLAAHGSELDPNKLEVLLALADANGKICYQDFVNLVSERVEFVVSVVEGRVVVSREPPPPHLGG